MTARQLRRVTAHGLAPTPAPLSLLDFLATAREDLAWQDSALCAEIGGDLWFPQKGESQRHAKQICDTCPVQVECRKYAIRHRMEYGIWGGVSERARLEDIAQQNRQEAA